MVSVSTGTTQITEQKHTILKSRLKVNVKPGKMIPARPYVYYHYSQPGYSDNGVKKELTFDSVLPRSLKMHAYLKVGYNDKRQQVINWEKVNQKDIPQAALNRIQK